MLLTDYFSWERKRNGILRPKMFSDYFCLDITTSKVEQIPYGERVTLRPEPLPERQTFQKGKKCLVTSQTIG